MLIDFIHFAETRSSIETDVCIIGAGAAGISLAKSLLRSGHKVLLIEAGGLHYSEESQSFYRGRTTGMLPGKDGYLTSSRLRYFGGTTNHWAGWCRPLDPIDFQKRDWVPFSGWPIQYQDLLPHYNEASVLCEIPAFDGTEVGKTSWWRPPLDLEQGLGTVETKLFFFSPPTKFGMKYQVELFNTEKMAVGLNGNCTRIQLNPTGQHVEHVVLKTFSGKKVEVKARYYALCAGGIESARILLNSDDVQKNGVGNSTDQVGRYFMEHPTVILGQAAIWRNWYFLRLYTGQKRDPQLGIDTRGVLCTTARFQQKAKTLNFSAEILSDGFSKKHDDFAKSLFKVGRAVDQKFEDRIERDVSYPFDLLDSIRNPVTGRLCARVEQVPDPANRVALMSETDPLGMRRIRLDWKFNSADYLSIQRSVRELARAFSGSFRGRVRLTDDYQLEIGNHHMGTTRMGENPKESVVDADCRVHGIANLYVGGSSVFTTSGFANPTLTLVALSLRLGEHLKERLKS